MDINVPFHIIWDRIEVFKFEEPVPILEEGDSELWCGFAQEFYTWITEEIFPVKSDIIAINQAKIILFDKYLAWRSFVPKSHQDYIGSRGHVCIFHAFIKASEHLQVAELRLKKPMLFIPPPPPPPPPPRPKGPMLFLGEVDE